MSKLRQILDDLESLGDGSGASHAMIDSLSNEIKTLIPEWVTLRDFEANPSIGHCWVGGVHRRTVGAFYKENGKFYESEMADYVLNKDTITHVMPLRLPEAPK